MTALQWEPCQGGKFRECTAKGLWGKKWESVLCGGSDAGKLDVVFWVALSEELVENAAKTGDERELIRIMPARLLWEPRPKDGYQYITKEEIKKVYLLKEGAELQVATSTAATPEVPACLFACGSCVCVCSHFCCSSGMCLVGICVLGVQIPSHVPVALAHDT